MATPPLRLTYFNIEARAEPVRLALKIGGVPFEDVRLTREAFMKRKAEGGFPTGQLPILEVGSVMLSQSHGLARYAARLAGIEPADPLDAAKVDMVAFTVEDVYQKIAPSLREQDAERKAAMRADLAANTLPPLLAALEALLPEGATFFFGDSPTLGDIWLLVLHRYLSKGVLDGVPPSILEPYTRLSANVAAMMAHPAVAAHYAAQA
eukprot:CAMPEP_0198419514 /NCGR_PEP_ID=MMETSP1452-20131203/263_1 /TAXON_ID=1181717 /ORGANISM="Synchroma pusillum, Strain CCMP3072" /LENGTH=207 /DNA_ID=CAMNT_0044139645 /DNA_START=96 /DNA_END=719 /DNA_ORIENTATION=-